MRKEVIQVALALTLATAALAPIAPIIKEPIRIEAAVNEANYPYWFTPDPDYRPVDPVNTILNKYNLPVYNIWTLGDIEDITRKGEGKNTASKVEGSITMKDLGITLDNGSDITDYITSATSPTKYLDRKFYYYKPGAIDTVENAKDGTSTSYYFTAPYTGQVRFRAVNNETPYNYIGIEIYEVDNNKVIGRKKSNGVGGGVGRFYAADMIEGKKYRLSFASCGGDYEQKFEMFFMKMMDNNKGKRVYIEDKWYTYTVNHDYYDKSRELAKSNTYTTRKNFTQGLRETTIKVDLKCDSKVTFELIALNYKYEGWSAEVNDYGVYEKTFLDSGIIDRFKENRVNVQTFSTPKDLANEPFKVTLNLKKGVYYLPVVLSRVHYDIAFRYNVEPVIETYAPKVTSAKAGGTYIKGECIPGTEARAKINGKYYGDKTTATGKFSIKVPTLKKGTKVSVYLRETNGSVKQYSKTVTMIIK